MIEKLQVKRPIYPLLGILVSVLILVFGLLNAKDPYCTFFLGVMWILFLCMGYWRACLAVLPIAAVFCAIFSGITYAITRDVGSAFAAANRISAVCIAVLPGLALSPIYLMRSLSQINMPRTVTLGMMITLSFFPLLAKEIRQVREAMKTRGAGSMWNPRIFYRAFLIPLVMRLVNISDTLALSMETRGFTSGGAYTVYRPVKLRLADVLFTLIIVAMTVLMAVI